MPEKKLRIAMIASNVVRIPPVPPASFVPPGWSGAPELVVHLLTEELVRRGHKVTLFASGDSKTKAKLVSVTPKSVWNMYGLKQHKDWEHILISKAYQMARQGKFDIIHSHFDTRTAYYAPLVDTPTLSTLHSPLNDPKERYTILQHYKKTQYWASISNNQRKAISDMRYAVTAYNGIQVEGVPFSETKERFFIFAGRIKQEKGVYEAIQVALKTKHKLYLFGSVDEQDPYWLKKIKPFVDGKQIIFKGIIPRSELFSYFARAQAFIFPLQWEEPFGLVTVEAMACGTPTIAFPRGSLPEIIQHGKTGFLPRNLKEMVACVSKLDQIDPQTCRRAVEKKFSVQAMVARYEKAYYAILKKYSQKKINS